MNDTLDIIERAFDISFKANGFCNLILTKIILSSIEVFGGSIEFGNHFYLNEDVKINYIILGDDLKGDLHKELKDLAGDFTLDFKQKRHLRLIEDWMFEWPLRFD